MLSANSPEEENGELATATACYFDQIAQRMAALDSAISPARMDSLLRKVAVYDALRQGLEGIEGFLHSQEGFALYQWVKGGPGQGAVVEIGSLMGRSTAWLASAARESRRGKVVAVDHFQGSPEHQAGASHPVTPLLATGTTLAVFTANLDRLKLRPWSRSGLDARVEVGHCLARTDPPPVH